MKTLVSKISAAAMTLAFAAGSAAPALALPVAAPTAPSYVVEAAVDCHAVGLRVANREGGELLTWTAQQRGGKTVCVVVLKLPPAKQGDHWRKKTYEEQQ